MLVQKTYITYVIQNKNQHDYQMHTEIKSKHGVNELLCKRWIHFESTLIASQIKIFFFQQQHFRGQASPSVGRWADGSNLQAAHSRDH